MEFILKVVGAIGLVFIIAVLFAVPTYLLWNWLMPDIFELTKITFWQALGLNLLASCLFGGSNSKSND